MASLKGFAQTNENSGGPKTGFSASRFVTPVAFFGVLFALNLFVNSIFVSVAFARDYSDNSGYLSTTDGERGSDEKDLLIPPPPPDNTSNLNAIIFNDKLNKEFKEKYEQTFGYSQLEQVLNSPNPNTYYNDIYGFQGSAQAYDQARSDFGNYVIRRLAEYHVDNYAKTDPNVRPLWEAKERLSQVKVEIQKVRFDVQYSIAGNTLDLKAVNPWLTTCQVRLQMNPGAFGPGPVDETIISVGRPITTTISAESHYKITEGIVDYILRKSITPHLGGTLTFSTFTNESTISVRESRYLSGLSYIF
jgi:hypothetical protein